MSTRWKEAGSHGKPRQTQRNENPWHLARVGIALIFIWAGIVKVCDPYQFAGSIQHYHLTSERYALLIAFFLPWAELVCGGTALLCAECLRVRSCCCQS